MGVWPTETDLDRMRSNEWRTSEWPLSRSNLADRMMDGDWLRADRKRLFRCMSIRANERLVQPKPFDNRVRMAHSLSWSLGHSAYRVSQGKTAMVFKEIDHGFEGVCSCIFLRGVAKYAKTGCNDTCGNNVTIPFPFGIGAGCAVNEWYIVECNNSTPYLPAVLNRPEVLGVNLEDQTVTVSTPRITAGCQNPVGNISQTMSTNLGGSPFFFSKSHNHFVFEGCGTAAITIEDESMVTGCSTTCVNGTFSRDGNNCVGDGCCQTASPRYFRSYSVNIIGLGEACGSAFLVDQTNSYDQKNWFSDPFIYRDAFFIPVSLLWTLTDSDQIACCSESYPERPIVGMFNGAPVKTLKCYVSFRLLKEDNPYLKDGCGDDAKIPKYSKAGCKEMCGDVQIPFPFGIGASCAVNHWYIIDCNSSTPYLQALNHLKVLGVDLENQTVTVATSRITDCQNPVQNSSEIMGVDIGGSPFLFSRYNKFVFKGCGNAVMMMDNGSVLTACSTACRNGVTHELNDRDKCFGMGDCCETTIPYYFKSYSINLSLIGGLEEKNGGCGSAFLVDETSYHQETWFSGMSTTSLISASFLWTLADSDQVTCCDQSFEREIVMLNGTMMDTLTCFTSRPSLGNSYLIDGCKDIDYVVDPTEECRRCQDRGGYCTTRDTIYDVDGFIFSYKFYCYLEKRTSLGVILGVSISTGVLFLVGFSYFLYKWIKKTKEKRQRKRFFKRNGGLLLKQQEEADPSLVDKTIHFTSRELQKATDNFNENRILGRGGQGTVYKGMLVDGRIVAVKKSKIVDESQLEHFINEVVILSQINHRNVVKLLGCCLETEVPVLVSEFIPNGTLYDRLHNETDEFPISLDMRLQIATEVASALAYLHSATSIPIYHRDIKTTNILLDEKYRAKVSDFGTSRFVSIDQTHLTTLVKGTFGYLDPEYFQSSQFTEKSDVYSFGVVLVELLTGEKPISLTRFGENRSLASHFMLTMQEGRIMSIFDAIVIKEGTRDELMIAANLAMRCLNMNGKYRPTMKEVAVELENIRRSHVPSKVQMDTGPVVYGEELSMLNYGESSTTFLSFNESISQ
ncbi:hypothetical protein R6Q59_007747 [Mikania micrantha]